MGKHQDDKIRKGRLLYRDRALVTHVSRLGKRFAARSSRPRLPWTFRILDLDVVTAYALVGGHVYVSRGLLAHLSNEAELAALLCHEIGHIEARHHLGLLKDFWERVLRLAKVKRVAFNMEAHWIWLQSQLPRPPFLQQLEADALALSCLRRNGYPPRAMLHLAQMLQRRRAKERLRHRSTKAAPTARRDPEWAARIKRLRKLLGPGARPDRPLPRDLAFLRRLNGLPVAPHPESGVLLGRRYVHPRANFGLNVPRGWKTRLMADALMATSPDAGAHLLVFGSPRKTPTTAIRAFVKGAKGPAGVPVRAGAWRGLQGATGQYDLTTRQRARVVALRTGGEVWVVVLASPRARFPSHAQTLGRVIASLGPAARPRPHGARPWRISVRRAPRTLPLKAWTACVPTPAGLAPVWKMNQLTPEAVVSQGRWLKCVTRGPRRGR